MPTFEPEKLPIKPEDAQAILRKVLDARELLRTQHYGDWTDLMRAYRMGRIGSDAPGLRIMAVAIENLLTFIAHEEPSFFAEQRRPGAEEALRSKIGEAALNYEWREGRCSAEAYKAALDALICGTGFVRVGYDPSGMFVPISDYEVDHDVPDEEENEDIRLLNDLLEEAGLSVDHPLAHPYIQRISPWNVVIPPGYEEIRSMPWVAIRHLLHIDDVRNDSRFRGASKLQANKTLLDDKLDSESPWPGYALTTRTEPEHIEIWEVWYHSHVKRMIRGKGGVRRSKRVRETRTLWLTEASEEDLTSESSPIVLAHKISFLDMGGYPLEEIRFSYSPNSFFGPSVVERMLPVSEDIHRLWDAANDGMRRSLAMKTLVKKGILTPTARKKLASSSPEVVEVQSRNLQADIRNLNMPAFPQEMAYVLNMARSFVAEMGGGDEAMRGAKSSAGTATEVSYRAQVTEAQTGSKLRSYERFLSRIGAKIFQLMQQFFDSPRWVQITGEEDARFLEYSKHEIRGELSIGVHAGSTKPAGPDVERAALLGFMGAVGQIIQTLGALGAQPPAIAEFITKAMDLWDQDSPALRDAFAEAAEQSMKAASAPPTAAQGSATVADGAAVNPTTGAPLTVPAQPGVGGLAGLGGGEA